jgi:hypothetical protein
MKSTLLELRLLLLCMRDKQNYDYVLILIVGPPLYG